MVDINTPLVEEIELPTVKGDQVNFRIRMDPYTLRADQPYAWTLYQGGHVCGSFVFKDGRYWFADDDEGLVDPRDDWRKVVHALA